MELKAEAQQASPPSTAAGASRRDELLAKIKINGMLLVDLTKRDFKLRYLGSLLGSYWNLIHPLMMILIYTMIFSQVMKSKLGEGSGPFAYSLYLCAGIFAWNFSSEVINRSAVTLLENAAFLKKISIPPLVLFGATFLSALINFLIAFAIYTCFLIVLKPVSIVHFGMYIVVVLLYGAFSLAFGITLGCLNVFLRDVQQLLSVIFQLWFWFTPIVYLYDALPEVARKLLWFNPAYPFMSALHKTLYYDVRPSLAELGLMLAWVAGASLVAAFVYRRSISFVRDQL